MPLTPSIAARDTLPPETREAMFRLHSRYFANVRRDRFMEDLDEKHWVILLSDPAGGLAGFSTQMLITLPVDGKRHRFLFSGDTIVAAPHRNTPLLAGCFGHLMLRLIREHGEEHLYWFLISKGFRTYRFLPVFFREFWPAPGRETPATVTALIQAVAWHKFGGAYDAASGVIRPANGDRLADPAAGIPSQRRRDPHVAFFARRNPGHGRGEELACLAPIRTGNLNDYARRVIRATTPEWKC